MLSCSTSQTGKTPAKSPALFQRSLLGLFEESDEERNKREKIDNLRNASIDLDLKQERSLNLLQATQLAEKQSLNSLF